MISKNCKFCNEGSARWDEKKEGGWKDRMDDWKLQQGNLGPDPDDSNDPDMALYVLSLLKKKKKIPYNSMLLKPQ